MRRQTMGIIQLFLYHSVCLKNISAIFLPCSRRCGFWLLQLLVSVLVRASSARLFTLYPRGLMLVACSTVRYLLPIMALHIKLILLLFLAIPLLLLCGWGGSGTMRRRDRFLYTRSFPATMSFFVTCIVRSPHLCVSHCNLFSFCVPLGLLRANWW